jgi:hypothetical protein
MPSNDYHGMTSLECLTYLRRISAECRDDLPKYYFAQEQAGMLTKIADFEHAIDAMADDVAVGALSEEEVHAFMDLVFLDDTLAN